MMIATLCLSAVTLLPSPFLDNVQRERAVIEAIDPVNLTWTFRVNAGLDSVANTNGVRRLGGWERPDIGLRGHTCGHWLSGMAGLYENAVARGDEADAAAIKANAGRAVHELKLCQDALKNGYLSAYPEAVIDKAINEPTGWIWAPWYTLHKILAGLLEQYTVCGNEESLLVARRFGDWAADKLLPLDEEHRAVVRKREFGGIGEAMYNLYAITKDERHLAVAKLFFDPRVMDPLTAREDKLNGWHANTFLPKVIAEMRAYELLGDEAARGRAEFFWRTVVDHYLYAPGCMSTKESFRGPDRQADFLTGVTGESCCTYNMLKLSRHLFAAEPRAEIADYQERALWNHILGQQEPWDGRVTYFMPMMTGAYKLQNRANDTFWCCVGSAMESQTRFARLIYAEMKDALYVNQFIPSEVDYQGVTFRLETRFPAEERATLTVVKGAGEATVKVRAPWWANAAAGAAPVKESGEVEVFDGNPGAVVAMAKGTVGVSTYKTYKRSWKVGDKIEIPLVCSLRKEVPALKDHGKDVKHPRFAVFYGPILMAGCLGTEGMAPNAVRSLDYYMHDYQVPAHLEHVKLADSSLLARVNRPNWKAPKEDDASPDNERLWVEPTFVTPEGILVKPLWAIHGERFVTYWN